MPTQEQEIINELKQINGKLDKMLGKEESKGDITKLKEPKKEEFECEVCGRSFGSRNGLNAHMRSHKD